MDRAKMEVLTINHQRRRCRIKAPMGFEADHIIPYCISLNDSKENIQFLTKKEHNKKSIIDRKIIKYFKKMGWIEKVTNYSHDLLKPMDFLINEYKLKFNEFNEFNNIPRSVETLYGRNEIPVKLVKPVKRGDYHE